MKTMITGRTAFVLSALLTLSFLASCQPNAAPAGAPGDPAAQGGRPAGGNGAPGGAPNAQGGGQGGGGYAGGAGFGGGQRAGGRNQVIPVQTAAVTFGPLLASNTAAGAVSPETQSSVAAGATGTVKTIVRKAGEWVRTGEVVVQLDDTQLKLSLALAQTALQNAIVNAGFDDSGKPSPNATITLKIQYAQSDVVAKQKILEADKDLFKIGGVTQTTLDNDVSAIQNSQATLESLKASVQQSTMAVQTANLQVQQAQLNLANAAIKAPFEGQISTVNVHPGEFVGTSTAVFILVSRAKIITFSVPPSDAPGLSNRSPVKFTYGGQDYQALLSQIPAAPVGGLIPLTASLPANLSPPLGTVGTITYSMELARGALVPLQAVQSAENTTFVFTVQKGNKIAKSTVGILAETGAFAAVTGVAPGATVVLNPPPGLLVGSTVQPQAADVAGAPAAAGAKAGANAGAGAAGTAGAAGFDPSKLTPEQRAQYQARRKAAADGTAPGPTGTASGQPGAPAPGATPDATADGATNGAARGSFDPSKLTPEQRAQFQARRKAAADAAAASAAPATTTGGQ